MADTNQISKTIIIERSIREADFVSSLEIHSDNSLSADSSLPPKSSVVYEEINKLQQNIDTQKENLEKKITDEISKTFDQNNIYEGFDTKINNKFDSLYISLTDEVNRAKRLEQELDSRIDDEKERLDTFLAGADIKEAAIDTLKEVQDWIAADTTGTAELINNVSKIDERVKVLEQEIIISCGNSKC